MIELLERALRKFVEGALTWPVSASMMQRPADFHVDPEPVRGEEEAVAIAGLWHPR